MTEYANALGSAGSTNEQVIESFHASMNVYARNYACIEDVQLRFTSEARGQWARQHMQGGVRNVVSKATIKKRASNKIRKTITKKRSPFRAQRALRRMQRFGFYQ